MTRMKDMLQPLKELALALSPLLLSYVAFLAILKVTNLIVLLTLVFVVTVSLYLYNKFEWINTPIKASLRRKKRFSILTGIILILLLPFALYDSPYWIFILTLAWLWIIVALGINIQFGSAGIINLGAAAFWGAGAYTAGIMATRYGGPAWLNLLLGGVTAVLIGALLFIPILKTRSYYLALVTIAFVMAFETMANNTEWLGGSQGIVGIPILSIGGYSFLKKISIGGFTLPHQANFYYLATILGGLLFLAAYRLWNSWVGLTFNSFNEETGDETCAKCMGINLKKWKLIAFSIGNFYIGLAGSFYAHMNSYIAPPDITFYQSLLFLSAVILGGVDNIYGVSIAALLLVILPEKVRFLQQYWIIMFMLIVVGMLILRPAGLIPVSIRKYGRAIGKNFAGKNSLTGE